MQFLLLLENIKSTHRHLHDAAAKAVNKLLTIRNCLIGFYIVEYEQKGEDRARYGDKLLMHLSKSLNQIGLTEFSERRLREYRLFYQTYPEIRRSPTAILK
ncbi:MAG: DUF1016 N-terminal domain-containing protein [Adhaeribacter sp.]